MALGRRVGVATALVAVMLSACGKARSPGGGAIEYSPDPDALILRIDRVGGFLPGEHRLRELPMVSMYGDGRVFTLGAQIEIYPPPALLPLVVWKLSPKGIKAILEEARSAGLMDGDKKIENPTIMDASTTVFTVNASGKHSVEVYALDETTGETDDERAKLQEFQQKVGDPSWLPDGSIEQEETSAEPDRLQVIAYIPDPEQRQDEGIDPATLPWPLSVSASAIGDPYESAGVSGRCAVLEGEQLKQMLIALREANQLTMWASEARNFRLINKPVLPSDEGCVA